jgi:hypothetical protein
MAKITWSASTVSFASPKAGQKAPFSSNTQVHVTSSTALIFPLSPMMRCGPQEGMSLTPS